MKFIKLGKNYHIGGGVLLDMCHVYAHTFMSILGYNRRRAISKVFQIYYHIGVRVPLDYVANMVSRKKVAFNGKFHCGIDLPVLSGEYSILQILARFNSVSFHYKCPKLQFICIQKYT